MGGKVLKQAFEEINAVRKIAGGWICARYLASILRHFPAIARERRLAVADIAFLGERLNFRVKGCDLLLPGDYFSGARELWARLVYFAQPGFSITPGDTAVDLGANFGLFSLLAAKMGARVVAVEMQSGFLPIIEHNLRINAVTDLVTIEWGIVGGGSGLVADPQQLRSASHYFQEAPVLSMEEIIRSRGLERIDFLKVDIEGSEFDLLRSGVEWLSIVEKIAMEVHGGCGDVGLLIHTLKNAGLDVTLLENRGSVVAELPHMGGYLFARRRGGEISSAGF
jgi:FkbM family methyltransferase